MSDPGKYVAGKYREGSGNAWARLSGPVAAVDPADEDKLRDDVKDVQTRMGGYVNKVKSQPAAEELARGLSMETGVRGLASAMLHKRHQLNRMSKTAAAINTIAGLMDTTGPVAGLDGGLPE